MKVLDLDMDYFMESIAETPLRKKERLSEEEYGSTVWSENRVRKFLEQNLGLSKEKRLPGRIVIDHDEALYFWEELLHSGKLEDPFEVVHVDSHADLGLGFASACFLQEGFLTLPIETRRRIRSFESNGRIETINIADYLLWAIAYRMVSKITYCANPNGDKNDYCWHTLKDFQENLIWNDPVSNYIQLKYHREMDLPQHDSTKDYIKKYLSESIKDPEVELRIIPTVEAVNFNGDFDFVVMAQSPNYTPASADFIMDIFREYIVEI